jgi:nucleotidyltransferase/DNA polymerase involved in DNA repair
MIAIMKNFKDKKNALKDLQSVRNIGPVAAAELYSLGIKSSQQLKLSDPEELYERLKKKKGGRLDRCVLYQFRGAIQDIPWPKCKNPAR